LAEAGAPVASSSTSTARKPPPKPSNPYANYSTAASLGYKDPDTERLKAETERRLMQGVAGDWEVVSPLQEVPSQPEASTLSSADDEANLKREAEVQRAAEDERSWKLRKKTVGPGLGEIYDPGIIPIKLKTKVEEHAETGTVITAPITSSDYSKATAAPKWTKTQWKRAGEAVEEIKEESMGEGVAVEMNGIPGPQEPPEPGPKVEKNENQSGISEPSKEQSTLLKLEETPTIAPAAGASGSMFRKRKAPGSIGDRGKRQK
jgi:WW domain-binding protein 4